MRHSASKNIVSVQANGSPQTQGFWPRRKKWDRHAFSHEKSKGIIEEGRVAHFVPDVVDAFPEIEDELPKVRTRFQDSEKVLLT